MEALFLRYIVLEFNSKFALRPLALRPLSGHLLFYLLTRMGSGCADTSTVTLVAKGSKPQAMSFAALTQHDRHPSDFKISTRNWGSMFNV